jgi:hypothetical protein
MTMAKLVAGKLTQRVSINTAHDPEYSEVASAIEDMAASLLSLRRHDGVINKLEFLVTVEPVNPYGLGDRETYDVTVAILPLIK